MEGKVKKYQEKLGYFTLDRLYGDKLAAILFNKNEQRLNS